MPLGCSVQLPKPQAVRLVKLIGWYFFVINVRPTSTTCSIFVLTCLLLGGCLSDETTEATSDSAQPPASGTNSPPTITGSAPSGVSVGAQYTFTPTASDSDGDTLTFSVSNLPLWASFDTSTGTLSGTPTLADVGVYDNISISVSDGADSTSLRSFSIDVTAAAVGSLLVSWLPPTTNEDGSVLTDLAGFNIYYGTQPDQYTNVIRIDNPGIASFLVENLSPNTYYFSASSFNSSGIESDLSDATMGVVN